MSDLITKLREAIEETERLAQASVLKINGGVGIWSPDGTAIRDDLGHLVVKHTWANESNHIVRHDPATVLRRCQADRQILALHAPYTHDDDVICQTCIEGSHLYAEHAYPCPTLVLLAQGYGVEP